MTFSDPVQGAEDEYDDWYQNVHLPQVCQIPGVLSAQRFRLKPAGPAESSGPRNVAMYQLDGDPRGVLAEMSARMRSGELASSPAIDRSSIAVTVWEPNGPSVSK
jgi:hypothetical protein